MHNTAVSHTGLQASVDGKPAHFPLITKFDAVIFAGQEVARAVEAVAVQTYSNTQQTKGILRVVAGL